MTSSKWVALFSVTNKTQNDYMSRLFYQNKMPTKNYKFFLNVPKTVNWPHLLVVTCRTMKIEKILFHPKKCRLGKRDFWFSMRNIRMLSSLKLGNFLRVCAPSQNLPFLLHIHHNPVWKKFGADMLYEEWFAISSAVSMLIQRCTLPKKVTALHQLGKTLKTFRSKKSAPIFFYWD